MKTFKQIVFWSLCVIALIQFIPVDHTNKPVKSSEDFVSVLKTPVKIQMLLKNACYDCHSNETVYPDYAFVAPISWSIKHHVNEAHERFNFSEWMTLNRELKQSMLENAVESIENMTMPMPAYVGYHPKAILTKAERQVLINYFQGVLDSKKY